MAGPLVQSATESSAVAGTGCTLTFGGASTAGNTLFAFIAHIANPGTYTPPAGWSQIGATLVNGGLNPVYLSAWKKANAAPLTSAAWTWANSVINVAVMGEIPCGDLDQSNTNSGNSSTLSQASILNQTAPGNDIFVFGFAQSTVGVTAITFSAPANSFTDLTQIGITTGTKLAIGFTDFQSTDAAGHSTNITSSDSDDWLTVIEDFAAFVTPPPAPIQDDRMRINQTVKLASIL